MGDILFIINNRIVLLLNGYSFFVYNELCEVEVYGMLLKFNKNY